MPLAGRKQMIAGSIVGLLLLIGAILAVVFYPKEKPQETIEATVRPLKAIELGKRYRRAPMSLPGRVSAGREVAVAFEVTGRLIELAVKEGDEVQAGDLIAVLDPSDYENNLNAATARRERAKAQLDRMEVALQANAVSRQEYDDAKAGLDVAIAEEKTAAKALADTRVYADFDGVIAERYVSNFESITAKQEIVSLQNLDQIEVVANVSERRMAQAQPEVEPRIYATFEYFPGREFDMTVKEFASEADPRTQTFLVTLVMDRPDDLNILPGMSATVHVEFQEALREDVLMVPMDAVVIDGVGNYGVWRLVDYREADETYAVARVTFEPGEVIGGEVVVRSGLSRGELIAGAGVNQLSDGQRVRRLEPVDAEAGADS